MRDRSLTIGDMVTMRSALNRAIDERLSYADSWGGNTPEAKDALVFVAKYKRLYTKLFGEPCQRDQEEERMRNAPTVSIFELHRRLDEEGGIR